MITARYEGRCPGCGEPIEEGDQIGMVDEEWCCERCVEDAGEDANPHDGGP
jgi:hypothetical protein